ncbi:hypothetical protein [Paenibacillus sp. Mc5Re-14]|uniref:hypothetical protein n=1 Tax=Paenibacillus sp. Mc5Re-14 TaxID=1030529 RepID=UPI000AAA285C|nr:hypothetical protein [Paenibacillus sp. Mc5Re-14]
MWLGTSEGFVTEGPVGGVVGGVGGVGGVVGGVVPLPPFFHKAGTLDGSQPTREVCA